ncbi:MAG: M23 family metallopeptidase [Ghiorsea sp.]
MFRILFVTTVLCWTQASWATTYQAAQGDVVRIPAPIAGKHLQVQAFDKSWPIYQHEGKSIAWIGIHLTNKLASYKIIWTAVNNEKTTQATDTIVIKKGNFRISHIEVTKTMSSFDKAALKRIRRDQAAIKRAYATPVDLQPLWPEMIWPVKGVISTPFAAQRYVNNQPRSPHSGLDIAAPVGTPVVAPLAGQVVLVEDMFLNGTLVTIAHGNGLSTVYAHLHKAMVKVGDVIKQGEKFAEVGTTGRSTGPHLHWGVQFNGNKISPKAMLKEEK